MKPDKEPIHTNQNDSSENNIMQMRKCESNNHKKKDVDELCEGSTTSLTQKVIQFFSKQSKDKNEDAQKESLVLSNNERNCKVCMMNEITILFTPCGHLVACKECASSLFQCPICRNKIIRIIKVYYS